MQNVEGTGDFEHYQGIWRLQSLPRCSPSGGDACRLTYAVEIKPKGFLPVGLIESRIASDLKNNLDAIRMCAEISARGRTSEEMDVKAMLVGSQVKDTAVMMSRDSDDVTIVTEENIPGSESRRDIE